ncbi:acyl-CoA synthetase short chain family member 2 like [Rhinichthys klamathensis goyatoka]|uniref:acyl-CoA synthetase short chain family member 2 like n=1 Tax=Rhinichthys klamathensis goyatoka TaxID=3034132 RepID=UPI0024B56F84|nr:acyl-CoA synthetase short chain family member 2 like [Rhinichthys klamathensis goyatoka]
MSPVSDSSNMVAPGTQEPEEKIYHPSDHGQFTDAHVPDFDAYLALYKKSMEEPEGFWGDVAQEFYWKKPPSGQMLRYNFDVTKGDVYIKFMEGAKTNICYNVLDRNVHERNLGEKVAYYWEGNSPDHHVTVTYSQLLRNVCRCANALKLLGVKKGDRVAIYLPMIPELVYTMLACARIGAVHSIVFAGFSSESLCERIMDAQCNILVTADGVYRGDKLINLKKIASEALQRCKESMALCVQKCVVVRHHAFITNSDASNKLQSPWDESCDIWWDDLMDGVSDECEPEWMDSEDPLFILYTSGSTGKPKGVVHTVTGYMLYTSLTFKYVFDYHHDDVYWCTADIGWITGHSYITYGPLANGATSVLFEGVPVYPHVGRLWEIIEKYGVSKFYTAPTAIRLLMKYGREPLQRYDLSSLRVLGTVGEPINPEAWLWYYDVVGQRRCPVIDTFWQTETGGHVLTPLPAATPLKPGSATCPFFGVQPAILNEHGEELEGEAEGYLVFRKPWPGIMRGVYGNQERFESTYFRKFPGFYVTGDGCRRDKDGYYWITGRIDDMLNVSGHLLSTAEVEAALSDHPSVAEAAVVSRPHAVKGECLYCFITLKEHGEFNRTLTEELKRKVREKIGPIATPDFIQNAPGLPKTRSGKIMRRVLRQIARNEKDLGDLSTLADPKVVEVLFSQRC